MKINKIIGFSFIILSVLVLIIYFGKIKITDINNQKYIEDKIENNSDYYAIIEIPKIDLTRELFRSEDSRNKINDNILVHKESIFPPNEFSNIILAGHSGNGSQSYFKNLYKLQINDLIYLYLENNLYEYKIIEIDFQNKTGELFLNNYEKGIITLITCTKNNNKLQTIYYAELKNSKKIEKNG